MATLTFATRTPEAIGRGPWTSHDSYEVVRFLVQTFGIVCVGVFLYSLGPALGIAVLACGMVAWSRLRTTPLPRKNRLRPTTAVNMGNLRLPWGYHHDISARPG